MPGHHQLRTALESARAQSNGGFNLDMWATLVNRDGVVCEVAFFSQPICKIAGVDGVSAISAGLPAAPKVAH